MKTIAFISFPALGHINPQYNLCKELSTRDIKLVYITAEKYKDRFAELSNTTVITYPKEFMDYYENMEEDSELSSKFVATCFAFYALAERVAEFTIQCLGEIKPDLVMCDTASLWGKVAVRYLNIPYAYFFSSFMLSKLPAYFFGVVKSILVDFPYMFKYLNIRKKIERRYGNVTDPPSEIMSHQNVFSIVHTAREFHPFGTSFPENVHFMRPDIYNFNDVISKKDTIFFSLGTSSYSRSFWDLCLEATKNFDYRVVITFGNNLKNKVDINNVRERVEIFEYLSLNEFHKELERAAVFVTHGGFNSITDAIVAETKMLVCPIQTENAVNGEIVEKYGCGQLLRGKKITAKKLETGIGYLLKKDCTSNLRRLKKILSDEKTCDEAINLLFKEYAIES